MKRSWPGPSHAEARFEAWIRKQYEARVLTGETALDQPCPDESFLKELARKAKGVRFDDSRAVHAASCRACMSRLQVLRRKQRVHIRRSQIALAGVVCLILIAAWVVVPQWRKRGQETVSSVASISKTVNLWNAGTYRGQQPAPLKSVVLPAKEVRLTIILPRFSQAGRYLVAVTRNPDGTGVIAEGTAASILKDDQETVSVPLDLRNAKAGAYFFSTTHEQNQAAYYYPLRIR